MLYAVAVFAPLLGSIIAGLFGRQIGDRPSQLVTIICMIIAAICGVASFIPVLEGHAEPGAISLGAWVDVEGFRAEWALRYDTLSAVMVGMVTFVSCFIHIYSVGYSSALGDLAGQVFAMFVLTDAAAEAAIGLAIVVVYYRNRGSIQVEDITMMKG